MPELDGLGRSSDAAGGRPPESASPASRETVVLLHGLGRTRWSMSRLAAALARDGYDVHSFTYPSRVLPLAQLATEWLPARLRGLGVDATSAAGARRVHFVTHSMGGIVVRLWLQRLGVPPNLGRTVMLAPPNAGSEVADRLDAWAPLRWFAGVNGAQLGTRAIGGPRDLGPWPANDPAQGLGVIAGARSLNPLFSAWIAAPNDGKVSVASTGLAGMRDHVVLPFSHTWLGWRAETARQVRAFLRTGQFDHARYPALGSPTPGEP